MRPDPSVSNPRLISTEAFREAVYHGLQLFIGRGRAWSVEDIAVALVAGGHKITARAVQSWIASDPDERRTPDNDALHKLYQLLPPAFFGKVAAPLGYGVHSLSAVVGDPAEIIASLADGTARFAVRGVDGVFCNIDRGALEPVADAMIEALTPFSSKRAG
jgi:hypothetical protein